MYAVSDCIARPLPKRQYFGSRKRPDANRRGEIVLKPAKQKSVRHHTARRENKTGLPDRLKDGAERISGLDLSNIRVSFNSPAPAQLKAKAFARGDEIHLAPGAERHLPHELWHSVQQRQGRVRAERSVAGVPVNDSAALEQEADRMGRRAMTAPMAGGGSAMASGASGEVAQLVGEDKFLISKLDPKDEEDAHKIRPTQHQMKLEERHKHAKVVNDLFMKVRNDRKQLKADALLKFQQAGFENRDAQKEYERRLQELQLKPKDLFDLRDESDEKVLAGYNKSGGYITYKGHAVGKILEGDAAYEQAAPAVGHGYSAVYRRKTFEGPPSAKEYVNVRGKYLRRHAYRGVTPPERDAALDGHPLRPANAHSPLTGSTGFNYDKTTGAPRARPDKGEAGVTNNDLEWLKQKSGQPHAAIPDDPDVLSLLQSRKGAGKLLSARSTPRPITSNHGASFSEWGEVRIDLAHVPTANVYDHYKSGGLSSKAIAETLDKTTPNKKRMSPGAYDQLVTDVQRSNATVRRNREIMLTEVPHAAVTLLPSTVDRGSPAGHAYRTEARRIYDEAYRKVWAAQSGQQGPGPAPPRRPDLGAGLRASEARRRTADLEKQASNHAAEEFKRRAVRQSQMMTSAPYGGQPPPYYGAALYSAPLPGPMMGPSPHGYGMSYPAFSQPPYGHQAYPQAHHSQSPYPPSFAMGYSPAHGYPPQSYATQTPQPAPANHSPPPVTSASSTPTKKAITSKLKYTESVFVPKEKRDPENKEK